MVEADLTNIQSFNKQSLFAGNFLTTTKVASNTDNVAFHRSSAVFGSLAFCELFVTGRLNIMLVLFFPFHSFLVTIGVTREPRGPCPPNV